jgi:hypothetical protein
VASTENASINELTDEVRGLRADFRVILTKMFGADDSTENPQGRIPRLESQVADHEERIGILEGLKQRAGGAGWLIASLVAATDLIYHVVVITRH